MPGKVEQFVAEAVQQFAATPRRPAFRGIRPAGCAAGTITSGQGFDSTAFHTAGSLDLPACAPACPGA